MLSEMSQKKTPHDFTYMWNLKNKTNEETEQKQIHRYLEQTAESCQRGEGSGEQTK